VPGLDTKSYAYFKAVAYAKAGFEEAQRKCQRVNTSAGYIQVSSGTTLALPNSSAQLAGMYFYHCLCYSRALTPSFLAAASSSTSPAVLSITNRAQELVNSASSSKSERALVKQEADLRSELDVTVNRIHYLLQYFDLLCAQHIKVLQELHVAEQTTADSE
jgi:hypothetical protein